MFKGMVPPSLFQATCVSGTPPGPNRVLQGQQKQNEAQEKKELLYIYPLIYTPLPNSTWLHHRALRYVRRVQLGVYMWPKGLNSVKNGSKWAKNTCLSIPNGLGSVLVKHVFDPVLTHIWPQNSPWSRHFGLFHGPKRVISGSKWAKNTCLSTGNGPRPLLEKCVFDPFLTHFWFQNGPFSRHFGIGFSMAQNAPLRAQNGLKTLV